MPRRPGPMPDSANVIRLKGNPSKLAAAEVEARRLAELPTRPLRPRKPAHLSPYAAECWDRLVPELEHLGLLAAMDHAALELATEAYALARYALDEMKPRKADGSTDRRVKRPALLDRDRVHGGQLKKHAAFAIYTQSAREFRAWCVEFGLTPSARVSLRPAAGGAGGAGGGVPGDSDDEFFGT